MKRKAGLARPSPAQKSHRLVVTLARLLHRDAEAVELAPPVAFPMPRSRRPLERRSNVAARSASRAGLWQGSTKTAVPSRIRDVLAARYVRKLRVAEICPNPVKWCSTKKTLWKPSDSASQIESTLSV